MTAAAATAPAPVLEPRPASVRPPTRPASRLGHGRSDLVVIGDAEHIDGVCSALGKVDALVHRVDTVEQALECAGGRALAHVLVTPLPEAELAAAVVQLIGVGPVFVVVPESFSDERALRLYEAGTAAVFEWPLEASLLPRVVQDRLALPSRPALRSTDGDDVLAGSIRTRLELARPDLPALTVRVDGGVVEIEGAVDSLWKKERVSQMVEHVPGVRAVLTEAIEVAPSSRSDAEIEQDVRGLLGIVLGDAEHRTVSISVEDGAVVLAGNVARREHVDRLLVFVGNVRGVRVIRNLVAVSAAANQRDRGLTERLSTALSDIYPDSELSTICFGPVAVVRGRVPRLSTKREILDVVAHQDGIERVVDKLEVVPPQS